MIYQIRHVSSISYSAPVSFARFNVRLRPAPWPTQRLLNYSQQITPEPATITDAEGPYVVNTSRLAIAGTIRALRVETRFEVEVLGPKLDPEAVPAPTIAEIREAALGQCELNQATPCAYLFASAIAQPADEIAEWARPLLPADRSVVAGAMALMKAIRDGFRYESGATTSYTPPLEAFRGRHGVCQDFAHIMIIAARAQGLPAGYVSGYLRTLPPPGKARLVGADAMHAWVNIWCGAELGWIGFDPTNNLIARTDHIFVAMGRDYADVAPLDGVFRGGGRQKLDVAVDVAPAEEMLGQSIVL